MRELSLNVMDIAQNSLSAGATLIHVTVVQSKGGDRLTISVEDNGRGMTPEQVQNVTDPFFTTRTTRRVGLGIPLFKMEAEMTGGGLSIASRVGAGTTITAVFVPSHLDMIPLGDIDETMLLLITCNPEVDFCFAHTIDTRGFTLDTRELRQVLGGEVPLNTPEVAQWLKEYLQEHSAYIKEENQNEVVS